MMSQSDSDFEVTRADTAAIDQEVICHWRGFRSYIKLGIKYLGVELLEIIDIAT